MLFFFVIGFKLNFPVDKYEEVDVRSSNFMFYFRSRGISKKKATSLLIQSFFSDIINSATDGWWDIDEKYFDTLVRNSINQWLENNNY